MVGLDQQSAPKQLINEVPSHVVLVNNKVGAYMEVPSRKERAGQTVQKVFHFSAMFSLVQHLRLLYGSPSSGGEGTGSYNGPDVTFLYI